MNAMRQAIQQTINGSDGLDHMPTERAGIAAQFLMKRAYSEAQVF